MCEREWVRVCVWGGGGEGGLGVCLGVFVSVSVKGQSVSLGQIRCKLLPH